MITLPRHTWFGSRFLTGCLLLSGVSMSAEVTPRVGHAPQATPDAPFTFADVPLPSQNDAAAAARFVVVDGRLDPNSGGVGTLHDGRIPGGADVPGANFFFAAGTEGGRLLVDLGETVDIQEINTFSWHPSTRGPQVYTLYAGVDGELNLKPDRGIDPTTCGWKQVADVDTRSSGERPGGQYAVSIADPGGTLGSFRYLLFDMARTEADDPFGNTFFSEIDVVDQDGPASVPVPSPTFTVPTTDGACRIRFDAGGAPELADWAEQTLAPVLAEWYPRIVAMLPSEGYVPPERFSVTLRPGNGVAYTSGTAITANSSWLKRELEGEAVGAMVHEVVHVVQQYGRGRRGTPNATRPPGWLVEGLPDYIRWFLFEPESHGADRVWLQAHPNLQLNYDAGYRVTANFIDFVVQRHDPEKVLVARLNAACRNGTYRDALWKEVTGTSLAELNEQWQQTVRRERSAGPEPGP